MSCAGWNNVTKDWEVVPKLGWEVEGGHGMKVTPGGECHQRQDGEDVGS